MEDREIYIYVDEEGNPIEGHQVVTNMVEYLSIQYVENFGSKPKKKLIATWTQRLINAHDQLRISRMTDE